MRGQGSKNLLARQIDFVKQAAECGIGVASSMMLHSLRRVCGEGFINTEPPWNGGTQYIHGNSYTPRGVSAAKRVIGFWTWETTEAPDSFAKLASSFTEIWTPSKFSRDALAAGGVNLPIHVVPHAATINPKVERTGIPRILVQADEWSRQSRKQPHIALAAAMLGSRGRRAEIIFKTHHMSPQEAAAVVSKARKITGSLQSIVINNRWEPDFLSVLRSSHILVSAARGEAFGLTLLEAMANGVAVCAHGEGGQGEFLVGYKCRAERVPARKAQDRFFETGDWWDCDLKSLSACVKNAVNDFYMKNDTVVKRAHEKAALFNEERLDGAVKTLILNP